MKVENQRMKTEIFGTFGPACASEETLKQMIEHGMTGMRLNLSHTTLADSKNLVENYHRAAQELGRKPQILIDMQGPELRVGELEQTLTLEVDEMVIIGEKKSNETDIRDNQKKWIPVVAEVIEAMEPGDEILLDDGKLLVQAQDVLVTGKAWVCKVCRGGVLRSHKSVKLIGKNIILPPLTDHDIANIMVAKEYGVTALMQPFVTNGTQIQEVRSLLKEYGAQDIKIYAKIENKLGVENLEDILSEADVIIIARGDLGNDMPLWELPKVQKEIEMACKKAGKPYIVVTQMLASMENHSVPTRAEVSDIYHAVYHGAWGVMLTGETAVGKYPVEAIQYLANTAQMADKE